MKAWRCECYDGNCSMFQVTKENGASSTTGARKTFIDEVTFQLSPGLNHQVLG